MDENEKKENAEQQTDETPKTDANEAPKTDVNEQPKKETTVITAKDKIAFYMIACSLVVIAICIIITVAPKIRKAIENYKIEKEEAHKDCFDEALDYLKFVGFSKKGLIQQLQHDGYTDQDINNALDLLETGDYVSWDAQAAYKAQNYMKYSSFSKQELYDQLVFEGFTQEQANYGVNYVFDNN